MKVVLRALALLFCFLVPAAAQISPLPGSGPGLLISTQSPVVSSVSPNNGRSGGGTSVAIGGLRFLGATSVTFGGVAASFTVNSAISITATSPNFGGATDTLVNVVVTTPAGSSQIVVADQFIFRVPNCDGSTGGSISVNGGYRIHTFTFNDTLSWASQNSGDTGCTALMYLVGGGGGGAGAATGNDLGTGGGGGGQVVDVSTVISSAQNIAIAVGAAGAAGSTGAGGGNGGISRYNVTTFTAFGGGGGGPQGGSFTGGAGGTSGSGNAGGAAGSAAGCATGHNVCGGGGGGGDSVVGSAGGVSTGGGTTGGAGGAGTFPNNCLPPRRYGAGGGGGGGAGTGGGAGGAGGGGAGSGNGLTPPIAGTANTGGGGGGGSILFAGAPGGNGIVVVCYLQ